MVNADLPTPIIQYELKCYCIIPLSLLPPPPTITILYLNVRYELKTQFKWLFSSYSLRKDDLDIIYSITRQAKQDKEKEKKKLRRKKKERKKKYIPRGAGKKA